MHAGGTGVTPRIAWSPKYHWDQNLDARKYGSKTETKKKQTGVF